MKKKSKKTLWTVIACACLVIFVGCLSYAGWYYWSRIQTEKEYEALREQMEAEEAAKKKAQEEAEGPTLEEVTSAEFTGSTDGPEPVLPEGVLSDAESNPVDFDLLEEINPELYAWIRIPNTKIDYPIAQHEGEEQNFYLYHDMYQNPQFAGCIYSQNYNSKDFSDPVTVLYGHNMKNRSMFQNLFNFKDADFFEENKYVYIYTRDKIRVYEIYAAYPYDDRNIMVSFDFTDKQVLEEYLEESQQPRFMEALVREGVALTTDSQILTLSTCVAGQTDQRFLVQAVLLYEEDGE